MVKVRNAMLEENGEMAHLLGASPQGVTMGAVVSFLLFSSKNIMVFIFLIPIDYKSYNDCNCDAN